MNHLMTERLGLLLDPGSFTLYGDTDDSELVGGTGTVEGRKICIIALNPEASVTRDPFEVLQQELALLELSEKEQIPLVHLADRPGRVAMATTAIPYGILQTFINSRGAGRIFARVAHLSGVVPRIAVVFRPIATTLTYPVAECEAVVMLEQAGMSLARPDMMKLMTHDSRSYEEYGGARMHAEISGTCDMLAASEREALLWVRRYLSYFPTAFTCKPPHAKATAPVRGSPFGICRIPDDPNTIFDTHRLLELFVDENSLLEHRALYAGEVITAFARVEGMPFGIIASNSSVRGGILFPESSRKISAFISVCDAFNIPLVFLADLPGFMVGRDAEQAGIIQNGALIFSTLANISVSHLCIIMRKAYTAGYYAMGGAGFDPDRILALQTADITIYGMKAIDLLAEEQQIDTLKRQELREFAQTHTSIEHYLKSGYIDGIITPDEIRENVREFLVRAYRDDPVPDRPRRILAL